MAHVVELNPLYPEMEEATIGSWLVKEGDVVTAEQPIAELITDKVAYEFASPVAGTILAILIAEKSVTPVGSALAVVGEVGEQLTELADLRARNAELAGARDNALNALYQATGMAVATPTAAPATGGPVRATPAARRRARELGIDMTILIGTGPGGMISVDDVESAKK
ncbi:MAG: E3 binding domain-containing protein [bacterium]